ncbi:MAG: ribbon-helix-helix protein, CopG family [Bdellovibrionales bacterium]|jgi:metal-responsive CopG/Arc/MetJ family transcriptional regulator|nr:ribbon-helix-helix protein, CopG family [Bdellovibrionales bacterium]
MKFTNKAQVVSVSLPLDMTKEVQEMARDERRSVSEDIAAIVREGRR